MPTTAPWVIPRLSVVGSEQESSAMQLVFEVCSVVNGEPLARKTFEGVAV